LLTLAPNLFAASADQSFDQTDARLDVLQHLSPDLLDGLTARQDTQFPLHRTEDQSVSRIPAHFLTDFCRYKQSPGFIEQRGFTVHMGPLTPLCHKLLFLPLIAKSGNELQ